MRWWGANIIARNSPLPRSKMLILEFMFSMQRLARKQLVGQESFGEVLELAQDLLIRTGSTRLCSLSILHIQSHTVFLSRPLPPLGVLGAAVQQKAGSVGGLPLGSHQPDSELL